ncbi:hypothetical protein [Haloechinothrix halophila]|uniref:hypothetical protein n=1 Tax=Haloechinothrix halophila TaxID=1069073 RepID=UPI0004198D7C|nr:hypothetical protein [Haloechinothrix halophila]
MTELAYMVREDWGQNGTAMAPSSARIRDWLGAQPSLFAVADVKKFNDNDGSADVEVARYLAQGNVNHHVGNIRELRGLAGDRVADVAVVVLHPYEERDCEALREVIVAGTLGRVFVLIWSPGDIIRTWLDAQGAVDLHTGAALPAPDPLQVAAADLMVNEEYNGLGSGRGKDAVVQLLRAFTRSGYRLDESDWLRAYFAAGGSFRHAETISKFIREMTSGIKHRVKPRFRDEIVDILREEVAAK